MEPAMSATSKAPAIARAAAILRLLGRSETPLGVQAIARDLGLVPSTCLYVLRALVAEQLVLFDDATKRYALDVGVLMLARQWLRHDRFADRVQPMLDRLSRQFDVTMLGVQIIGLDHIVVVATAQLGRHFQPSAQVGSRFPALISATGRCVAAFADRPLHELERRFETLQWDQAPSFAEWLDEVALTRRRGFALDEGNYITGVTVAAAPVWKTPGAPTHALVATALKRTEGSRDLTVLGEALVASAAALSQQIGGV